MAEKQERSPETAKRQRLAYVAERIRVLQAELKALRAEKQEIAEKLRAEADLASPEAKALKKRRIYVTQRPAAAKSELEALIAERRSLSGASPAG